MIVRTIVKIAFIGILLGILPPGALSWDIDTRENFSKAYSYYAAGSHSQARELFSRLLETDYPLVDYSLYYLALIAFQNDDWNSSELLLTRLRNEFPQSIWSHAAELQRAKIAMGEKKYPQAIDILRSLRVEKQLPQEISEEALYLQAQAQEAQGDVYAAYSLYQQLRRFAPTSRWTPLARKQVIRLREQSPEIFGILTVTAIADEADQLVGERDLGGAESLYKKLLERDLGPMLRLRFLTKLSKLYLAMRHRNDAIPVLEKIVAEFPDSLEAPNALYRIGQIFWNRNDNDRALEYFVRLMERYPKAPQAGRAQFAAADIYDSQNKTNEAAALYSLLPKKFPKSRVGDDSMWRLAWLHYRAGNWQQAHDTFKLLAAQARGNNYETAAPYWEARTAERLGHKDAAIQIYQDIVANDRESYYQALAVQGLARNGVTAAQSQRDIARNDNDSDVTLSSEAVFHLLRARELTQLKFRGMAVSELEEIHRRNQAAAIRLLLVREYEKNHAYAVSVRIANQLPDSVTERDLYRFPLAYWDTVKQRAEERDIDPYLIIALIRQESLFDAQARSPAAALGLMQLLPSTARRVGAQIGFTVPSDQALFDPELNLTLGTQYLKDLMQRYSNNWLKAIAAYNAGEAAVDRWNQLIDTDDIEEFVERIPYRETRQYVKLVMRNHRIYKQLYDQQK